MTKTTRMKLELVKTNAKPARPKQPTDDELAEMIEEATVDAYGPSEQVSGFYTMLEEHLDLPFATKVLGVDVVVESIDLTRSEEIVAICKRGLVLYSLDADGDRCITKKLDRGVFLLPVPAAGQKYVVLDASKIGILFRS
jgi:hypothetical protein